MTNTRKNAVITWRTTKNRAEKIALMGAEIARQAAEISFLRQHVAITDDSVAISETLVAQQADIQTLIRVRINNVRGLIQNDQFAEADASLAELVQILAPPKPKLKVV